MYLQLVRLKLHLVLVIKQKQPTYSGYRAKNSKAQKTVILIIPQLISLIILQLISLIIPQLISWLLVQRTPHRSQIPTDYNTGTIA